MSTKGNNLYGFPQPLSRVFPPPIVSPRAPLSTDFEYPIGQVWIDDLLGNNYTLVNVTARSATWNLGGSLVGPIATLTGDSGGAIGPIGGNIDLFGTANQITTAGAGGVITFSVPSTFIAPGSIASTTSIHAGTTLSSVGATTLATAGASVNTFGNHTGATSVSLLAGSGGISLTATNGAFTLTTGTGAINISADAAATTIAFGTGGGVKAITIGSTNTSSSTVVACGTLGASFGASANSHPTTLGSTTGTSTTTINAGSGGVHVVGNTSVTGNLTLTTAGNKLLVHATTSASDSVGTATLGAGGTVIVSTSAVTANSKIFLSYNNCTSALAAALSAPSASIIAGTSFVINSQDATDATSTVNYWLIN